MSPLTKVPATPIGGFQVQYTDDATGQANALPEDVRTRLHQHLMMVGTVNPYLHGTPVRSYGANDRRTLTFEILSVTFWLSGEVKVLTVVDIRTGGDEGKTPPFGTPVIPLAQRPTSPFIGFDSDEDDGDGSEILAAGVLAAG